MDLRQRVIDAVDAGESRVSVVARYRVSNAWIGKLLRQRRATGSIAPLPHAGGTPPRLGDGDRAALAEHVRQDRDATLAELARWAADERGVAVSGPTVCRALRALGLPLKKR